MEIVAKFLEALFIVSTSAGGGGGGAVGQLQTSAHRDKANGQCYLPQIKLKERHWSGQVVTRPSIQIVASRTEACNSPAKQTAVLKISISFTASFSWNISSG